MIGMDLQAFVYIWFTCGGEISASYMKVNWIDKKWSWIHYSSQKKGIGQNFSGKSNEWWETLTP